METTEQDHEAGWVNEAIIWCRNPQKMKFGFYLKFDIQEQGQSFPKRIAILIKVFLHLLS